jgi:hypothetical protein
MTTIKKGKVLPYQIKNNTLTTAFIIRMHFKKEDPRWSWRLAYFQSIVLPKILSQRDQDFDICIRANKHHEKELLALSPKIKVFDVDPKKKNWVKPGYEAKIKKYFVDFVNFEDIIGLDRYDIQIGIDSDDMPIRDDFVTRIKKEVEKDRERSLHISFQPQIFQPSTLRVYECPFEYGVSTLKGSPVFAIYQPLKGKGYMYAYEDSHLLLPRYMNKAIRIEDDYCVYSVHECNSSTSLNRNSKQIMI